MISRQTFWSIGWLVLLLNSSLAFGPIQESQDSTAPAKSEDLLANRQKHLADQIQRLETLLLRSADIEAIDNPTRAALLQQAAQLSKQSDLSTLLDSASKNLRNNQLSDAMDQQKAGRDAMNKLLELLQSENREKRVREQRAQVRRWIEDADRLLRMQSSLRGRTEGGQEMSRAAEDQSKLADKAEQIANELGPDESKQGAPRSASPSKTSPKADPTQSDSNKPDSDGSEGTKKDGKPDQSAQPKSDGQKNVPNSDGKEGNSKSQDRKSQDSSGAKDRNSQSDSKQPKGSSDNNNSDNNNSDNNKADTNKSDDGQESDGKSSETSEQGDSKSQQGQSQQGQSQQGQSQQGQSQQGQGSDQEQQPEAQTPTERARRQIQQAQERMNEAQQQLKDAKRQGAVDKQREAEENLKQAIQQLEEILKQLREEEVKRSLETLSTRIRRMLEMQTKINEESQRLHEIAGENPDRQILAKATTLARDQSKVAQEGERALLLLKEEGSSAAFPEALQQVNRDATAVSTRLDAGEVGKVTLLIQADILQALEEMVEALTKIKKENEEKKQQQQRQQLGQMDPDQMSLINKLAELRLIRTLQLRVNKRTTTLSQMLDNPSDPVGQAKAKDLMEQLQDLSKRQENIESVTRKVASED